MIPGRLMLNFVFILLASLLLAVVVGITGQREDGTSIEEIVLVAGEAQQDAQGEDETLFKTKIATLFSQHCLECHDSTVKKGKLDLSQKATAFKGGESGAVIVPGDLRKSLLWDQVKGDEMPPGKRPKLSAAEKESLRKWIQAGAPWSGGAIDPLAHARDQRAHSQWLRRLTVDEYIETVRAAVGVEIESDARRILPADARADGFSNTAYNLNVDLGHIEAYTTLAQIIVSRLDVPAFVAAYCKCKTLNDGCMRELISNLGGWLLRGPVQEHELVAFLRISKAVADEGGDFNEAARYILEAMLQSPRFIYRIENQRGDGVARSADSYELASRLSYTLWGGPPDRELMRAAAAGELKDRSKVEAQTQRMLKDPRAIKQSLRFASEWLHLDRLSNMRPNKARFPKWDSQLAADMRSETLAFFEEILWKQNRPLSDLLNAQVTFLTPRLAQHYGLAGDGQGGTASLTSSSNVGPGPLVLYRFDEAKGDTVHDRSGHGQPVHLKIEDTKAVRWDKGQLTITGNTLIASTSPPALLIDAIKKSNAITIEAWVTPANTSQQGPARIVSLSSGSTTRNFTLGQEGDKYDTRLRTTRTNTNGMLGLPSKARSARAEKVHLVYTRHASGKAHFYIDGEEHQTQDVPGDLSNWAGNYHLMLANESSKDRPWLGGYHRVAIYDRALSPQEIATLGQGIMRYDLSSIPARGGLLTQGSVLTIGGDEASMVARGLFILKDLLYSAVGNAPPGVDTTPVPARPGQSQRTIAELRLKDSSCSGCHSRFEPLAFALEKFDGVGAYSETDRHGNKLREDGQILIPGNDQPMQYKTSGELMTLLAGSERVKKNMTRKLTQFAIGRPLIDADEQIVDQIHETAQQGGGTYSSLMMAIVTSDLVLKTHTEK